MGAAAVGAIIQGISEMGTNMINSAGMELQRRQMVRNLRYQEQSQLMNLALQKMQWDREDNAVQRRVKDLKAAGLSPVLAAGSAAESSSPMRVEAKKRDYRYEPWRSTDIASVIAQAETTRASVERNEAETARIKAATLMDLTAFPEKLRNLKSKSSSAEQDAMYKALQNEYFKLYGVDPRSGSPVGKIAVDTGKLLNKVVEKLKRDKNLIEDKKAGTHSGTERNWGPIVPEPQDAASGSW